MRMSQKLTTLPWLISISKFLVRDLIPVEAPFNGMRRTSERALRARFKLEYSTPIGPTAVALEVSDTAMGADQSRSH